MLDCLKRQNAPLKLLVRPLAARSVRPLEAIFGVDNPSPETHLQGALPGRTKITDRTQPPPITGTVIARRYPLGNENLHTRFLNYPSKPFGSIAVNFS